MRELIAILRGVQPDEVVAIAQALLEAGIEQMEVPLNSPNPMQSIEQLVQQFGKQALIGAGTVLSTKQVATVQQVGGQLIVAPNCDPAVISHSVGLGMRCLPGVFTATDCFTALQAQASGLKFFPAVQLGLQGFKALKAVLPRDMPCYAVGGVDAPDFADWLKAGMTGFGIGTALYKPGDTAQTVSQKAKALVAAYDQAQAKSLSVSKG